MNVMRRLSLASVALLIATPCWARDGVSLQLKWLHQFQFAGYYTALALDFYKDAGLDVEIREGGPAIDAMQAVQDGKADFGICTTSVLLAKPGTPQVVVLGVIFQHSPAIILVPSRAHLGALSDLKGVRIMDTPGSDDVAAMLKHEGVDYKSLPRVQHNGDPLGLISGQADAMVSYSTNEPFVLGQLGVPYQTFSPRTFGFDFYGDNLCTSADQIKAHPERTRAFLAASLQGWDYALSHKEDTVNLILNRYSRQKSRQALLFEATESERLIQPRLVPLGSQTDERWQSISNSYRDLGMLTDARVPAGLIYRTDRSQGGVWLRPAVIGLALLAIGSVLFWLSHKQISRRLELALGRPKLSAIIAGLFACLSIPILMFILAYNYYRSSDAIIATLHEDVAKARQASIENMEAMIRGVAGTLGMLAEMAAGNPAFFRTEESRNVLYRALTSATEIDGAYVSFEDGYYRVVTRIDDDRRRSDPNIPPAANWHSSFIDGFSQVQNRRRHRTFFDTWEHVVGEYDVATRLDMRSVPGYWAARESRALVVTEPTINPDTGYPILSVTVPILRNGEFIGCASAYITLGVLSQFLAAHRASPHSMTIIADPTGGMIIAAPDKEETVRMVDGKLQVARLENIADDDVREAYRLQTQTNQDDFLFRSPRGGQELSASFVRFPESFGRPWEAVIITPTDDFIGPLKATNERTIIIIVALTAIELLLIYFLSRRLSQPIETISRELKAVESLSFEQPVTDRPSRVREIAQLQSAAALLRSSLKSFSSFAPVDLVKGLVKSGIPLALGVEKRNLTVLFTDLENFSTQAEQSTPDALLEQMSVYFEQVSHGITDEKGTVDKFIGDGIMAFWGAPAALPDHVLRACAGALRAARRMETVNRGWRAEGKPTLRIRIGLNTADVLVGNVGSTERFSYTVMGDGVNVAARLEGVNKTFGTTICISDSVFDAVSSEVVARPLRRVQVTGRKQKFMVYELLGMATSDDPELAARPGDRRLSELTSSASARFENGEFSEAARLYRDILQQFPGDPAAKAMLAACSPRVVPAAALRG
ncbi:MAG TPA: ABC transporter substrate-binding protein [Alphaproteobacteria bacterium]|nr:ABC transporter substrate-binding protein [Alphaproteobacteria bacterium]